ncbi:MAG: hypothetical protein BAJALOKI2v1_300027 [Promethearchaeota archaeon]|nr:MAG: hypothetical protein BAJALOKI2v1_300027 [Candidatus Lokiarchaeota archaeon]
MDDLKVFQLNENSEDFKEIKDFSTVSDIINSNIILILVDHLTKHIWIWNGKATTPRMKFIAARKAPNIRDKYGIDYKIASVDQGSETEVFRNTVGL